MWRLVNLLADTGISVGSGLGKGSGTIGGAMATAINFVEETILPIIYIVLGLFLVVKGALLGVQIVKAADEPQVRQEKIGSLKWLIIGVAIAYAVTAVANIVLSTFSAKL